MQNSISFIKITFWCHTFMLCNGIFIMLLDCIGRERKWWLQVLLFKILTLQICVSKTPHTLDICKLHGLIILSPDKNVLGLGMTQCENEKQILERAHWVVKGLCKTVFKRSFCFKTIPGLVSKTWKPAKNITPDRLRDIMRIKTPGLLLCEVATGVDCFHLPPASSLKASWQPSHLSPGLPPLMAAVFTHQKSFLPLVFIYPSIFLSNNLLLSITL